MTKKQKLELTWIGKENQARLEPRILIEEPEKSFGVLRHQTTPNPSLTKEGSFGKTHSLNSNSSPPILGGDKGVVSFSDNMLIHGDNLLALKALEQDFAGKIKCIYIDPPYNTGNAFEHYDDGLEHSLWLSLIKPRIEMLHRLLSSDGTLWISIDDDESHYLKVLCDEIFGRKNFVNNVIWEKKYSPQNDAKWLSDSHDHILVYAKNKDIWRPNFLPRTEAMDARYKNFDNDSRGLWKSSDLSVKTYTETTDYPITTPTGRVVNPPSGYCWRVSKERLQDLINDNRIWFGKDGSNVPSIKRFLSEVQEGTVAKTIWYRTEVGDNQEAKREIKAFNNDDVFSTPKPERLIQRILTLATNPGDLVLDSFLGSGTTAAVAHKMNRRWIGIELGEHCYTHCLSRLKKVVDGTDQGGISEAVNWQGGGGFRYYYLAPSLLKEDKHGNWIIDERYNAEMLASAMAKQEGFKYKPDEAVYWKQGRSTEKDFIFTTTYLITVEHLDKIHEEMRPDEGLLICCKSFQQACENRHQNITIKKIPKILLGRCEFGKEDYSLNIVNMPVEGNETEEESVKNKNAQSRKKKGKTQGSIFENVEDNF